MRPIVNLGLCLFLFLSASCAPDEYNRCLLGVSFHDYEISNLTGAIADNQRPSSYVAIKGQSQLGLHYLVVANYDDRSVATMYRTALGTRSVELSAERGRNLFDLATHALSETPKSLGHAAFDRNNCHFVRTADDLMRIDGKYVDPARSDSGTGVGRMFYEFDSLFHIGYGVVNVLSYADVDIPEPRQYDEEEIAALVKKNRRNVFRELDKMWLTK